MKRKSNLWDEYDSFCQKLGHPPLCQAGGVADGKDEESRQLEFVLSAGGITRNFYDIVQEGWNTENFRANPRVLWAHDDSSLPVATSVREWLERDDKLGLHLRGRAEFIVPSLNEFADRIYRMYLLGHLRAVSVRWRGIEVEPIDASELRNAGYNVADYVRGLRFKQSELYEYSCVAIPGDPRALMNACREGLITPQDIDRMTVNSESLRKKDGEDVFVLSAFPETPKETEGRLYVDLGAVSCRQKAVNYDEHGDLPVADRSRPWDAVEAVMRLRKWASKDSSGDKDKMDWRKYAKGFAYVDGDGTKFGDYKLPHHDIINGRLNTVPRGVFAAAQRIQQGKIKIDAEEWPKVRAHIEREYERIGDKAPWLTPAGKLYEEGHALLKNNPDDHAVRSTVEKLACDIYGEMRIAEEWEETTRADVPCFDKRRAAEILRSALEDGVREDEVSDVVSSLASCIDKERIEKLQYIVSEASRKLGTDEDGILAKLTPTTRTADTIDESDAARFAEWLAKYKSRREKSKTTSVVDRIIARHDGKDRSGL